MKTKSQKIWWLVPKVNPHLLLHEQPVGCFDVWGHEAILHPRPVTRLICEHWPNINHHHQQPVSRRVTSGRSYLTAERTRS